MTLSKFFLFALIALCLGARPAHGQSTGSTLLGKYDEIGAGVAGNIALRGPWIAQSWRRPLPRLIIWHAISFGYERFGDGAHQGKWDKNAMKDFMGREIGYFVTEALIAIIRRKL